MNARGDDVQIRINKEGVPVLSIANIREATWDPGIVEDIDNYLGWTAPDVQGIANETSLEITSPPTSADWLEVVEFQRLKNEGDADAVLVTIDVSFAVDFGADGGRARIQMRDCTLTGGGLTMSGRTDKVTANPRFVAGRWRRVA